MKKLVFPAIFLALGAPLLARTIQVTELDNNSSVTLNLGDELVVQLQSNASTGYSWQIDYNNSQLLRLTKSTYEKPNSNLMGAPGSQVFRFRAVGAGGEGLKLSYKRPGQGRWQSGDSFVIMVTVNRGSGPTPKPSLTTTLYDWNNHGSVTVQKGSTLVIQLDSNASTGYQWFPVQNFNNVLRLVKTQYKAGDKRPGASGTQIFTFQVVGNGTLWLRFLYQRSFEPSARGDKTWEVRLTSTN
jgi:predicted secreted protein